MQSDTCHSLAVSSSPLDLSSRIDGSRTMKKGGEIPLDLSVRDVSKPVVFVPSLSSSSSSRMLQDCDSSVAVDSTTADDDCSSATDSLPRPSSTDSVPSPFDKSDLQGLSVRRLPNHELQPVSSKTRRADDPKNAASIASAACMLRHCIVTTAACLTAAESSQKLLQSRTVSSKFTVEFLASSSTNSKGSVNCVASSSWSERKRCDDPLSAAPLPATVVANTTQKQDLPEQLQIVQQTNKQHHRVDRSEGKSSLKSSEDRTKCLPVEPSCNPSELIAESAGVSSKVLRPYAASNSIPRYSADHEMVNQLWSSGGHEANTRWKSSESHILQNPSDSNSETSTNAKRSKPVEQCAKSAVLILPVETAIQTNSSVAEECANSLSAPPASLCQLDIHIDSPQQISSTNRSPSEAASAELLSPPVPSVSPRTAHSSNMQTESQVAVRTLGVVEPQHARDFASRGDMYLTAAKGIPSPLTNETEVDNLKEAAHVTSSCNNLCDQAGVLMVSSQTVKTKHPAFEIVNSINETFLNEARTSVCALFAFNQNLLNSNDREFKDFITETPYYKLIKPRGGSGVTGLLASEDVGCRTSSSLNRNLLQSDKMQPTTQASSAGIRDLKGKGKMKSERGVSSKTSDKRETAVRRVRQYLSVDQNPSPSSLDINVDCIQSRSNVTVSNDEKSPCTALNKVQRRSDGVLIAARRRGKTSIVESDLTVRQQAEASSSSTELCRTDRRRRSAAAARNDKLQEDENAVQTAVARLDWVTTASEPRGDIKSVDNSNSESAVNSKGSLNSRRVPVFVDSFHDKPQSRALCHDVVDHSKVFESQIASSATTGQQSVSKSFCGIDFLGAKNAVNCASVTDSDWGHCKQTVNLETSAAMNSSRTRTEVHGASVKTRKLKCRQMNVEESSDHELDLHGKKPKSTAKLVPSTSRSAKQTAKERKRSVKFEEKPEFFVKKCKLETVSISDSEDQSVDFVEDSVDDANMSEFYDSIDESSSADRHNKRGCHRKSGILHEIANSDGFVADKLKKKSEAKDLFVEPSKLNREERALQVKLSVLYYTNYSLVTVPMPFFIC